jgi:3D (Asp-Asp-Asp) domain-containing protein
VLSGCAVRAPAPSPPPAPAIVDFVATAYTLNGKTASGTRAKPGIVAADPAVLPLGTRIRVHDAGAYSGEYTVADTGPKVKGRRIDIFLRDTGEAKRFGQKNVRVERLDDAR